MLSTLGHSSPTSSQPARSPRLAAPLLRALADLSLAGSDTDGARLFLDRTSSVANRDDRTALVRAAHIAAIMASAKSTCAAVLKTFLATSAEASGLTAATGTAATTGTASGNRVHDLDSETHGGLDDAPRRNFKLTNVRKRVWKRGPPASASLTNHSNATLPATVANASRRKIARKSSVLDTTNTRIFYDDDHDDTASEADDEEETAECFSSAAIQAAAAMAEILAGGSSRTLASSVSAMLSSPADGFMLPPLCQFLRPDQGAYEDKLWIASPLSTTAGSAASTVPFSFNAIDTSLGSGSLALMEP